MAWITDSLRGAIDLASRFNPFNRGAPCTTGLPGVFTHQLAIAAYMSSGVMRKVIAIPAEDRAREWRDWQAKADAITKIEAEEKRLGLVAKVQEAETLRGIGGGALVIITAGSHDQELKPDRISERGVIAINVVSRWQITGKDWVKDLASPQYGLPQMWEMDSGDGKRALIHPSRVICFRGSRLPAGSAISDEESFWGDSRLLRVYNEVTRSDSAQDWFAELVKKAKLLRIGIPDLLDMLSSEAGKQQLNERVALIASGENTLNATVYRSGTGADDPGEKIDDYQVNWAGIPAMMDAFDQRVAAVSDIPFTRLMGRSPAGMNATGAYDDLNWVKAVTAGQKLETRPCLELLDPFLLRSAGVDPKNATWTFAPLSAPTEKEQTDTFKTLMDAVEKVQATGAIPDEAFSEALQNLLIEREVMPGLEQALEKIPEAERYGLNPEDDGTDPSALQAGKEGDLASAGRGGDVGPNPARRANDGGSRTSDRPFEDARQYSRWPAGSPRGGQFRGGSGGFSKSDFGPVANASAIRAQTGVNVSGLRRVARSSEIAHASKGASRDGTTRLPPTKKVLSNYARHAERAYSIKRQGSPSGAGLRLRSEVIIAGRHHTIIERVGAKKGELALVTMWRNG